MRYRYLVDFRHGISRLDYQPLFGNRSPHSAPERGGTKTGLERAAEIEPRYFGICQVFLWYCGIGNLPNVPLKKGLEVFLLLAEWDANP